MYQDTQNANLPNQQPTTISLRTKCTTPTKGTENHQGQHQPQSPLLNNRKRTRYLSPPPKKQETKTEPHSDSPLEERSHNYNNQFRRYIISAPPPSQHQLSAYSVKECRSHLPPIQLTYRCRTTTSLAIQLIQQSPQTLL